MDMKKALKILFYLLMLPIITNQGTDLCGRFFFTLVELPPALRSCYENIIFHSSWNGSNPDFNIYLEKNIIAK